MSHRHQHPTREPTRSRKLRPHWLFVVGVLLMLVAMFVYVLTMDDSTLPEPGLMPVEQAADF